MAKTPGRPKSLYRRAFANQYNFILLGAAGLFALATFSWVPLIVGAGIEALWLVLGADTPFFRRWVEKQESKEEQARLAKEAAAAVASLDPTYRRRFEALSALASEIQRLAGENKSFEASLIENEMAKLGKALSSFLQMAVLHQRLGTYLADNDEDQILRDQARLEKDLAREKDPDVRSTLRQSLALAEKRVRQHAKILSSHKVLSLKMETLEKSMAYLQSHIVAMGRREELSNEIDDIVLGVETVDELSDETQGILAESTSMRARAAAKQGTSA